MASASYATIEDWLEATGLLPSDLVEAVPYEFLDSPFPKEELELQYTLQPQQNNSKKPAPVKRTSAPVKRISTSHVPDTTSWRLICSHEVVSVL